MLDFEDTHKEEKCEECNSKGVLNHGDDCFETCSACDAEGYVWIKKQTLDDYLADKDIA